MKSVSLTASDFFEKLQQDEAGDAMSFSLTGMAKKSEDKTATIQFAPGGNCSNWVTIPLESIEDVEVIQTVPCKDHMHPLVRLTLKSPKTAEGKTLFALLDAASNRLTPQQGGEQGNQDFMSSVSRPRPRLGGYRGSLSNSLCLWTWVDEWVCKTVGNTTTCGWVGSWKCI